MEYNWDKIKEKWGQLTKEELEQAKESKDKLVALVRTKYGQTQEAVERQLQEMTSNKDDSVAQQFVSSVIDKGGELEHQIADYSKQFSESVKSYVRNNPLSSVIWGLGIGFVLGKLTK